MKPYLFQISEKKKEIDFFIIDFENKSELKAYIKTNWNLKKYNLLVFEIKKCIFDNKRGIGKC